MAAILPQRGTHVAHRSLNPALVLSLSKDERSCSWFDTLTTSGSDVESAGARH